MKGRRRSHDVGSDGISNIGDVVAFVYPVWRTNDTKPVGWLARQRGRLSFLGSVDPEKSHWSAIIETRLLPVCSTEKLGSTAYPTMSRKWQRLGCARGLVACARQPHFRLGRDRRTSSDERGHESASRHQPASAQGVQKIGKLRHLC